MRLSSEKVLQGNTLCESCSSKAAFYVTTLSPTHLEYGYPNLHLLKGFIHETVRAIQSSGCRCGCCRCFFQRIRNKRATGAGAGLSCPLYSKWASDYNKATGVKINYQSVGSGAGLRQIEAKTVDFGASDAPLKDEDLNKKGLVQFPTVIGGVVPVVNISKGIAPGQTQAQRPSAG